MKTYQEYYDYYKDTGLVFLSKDAWDALPIKPKKAIIEFDKSIEKNSLKLINCVIDAKDGDVLYKWNNSFIEINLNGYAIIPADKYYKLLRYYPYPVNEDASFIDKVKQFFKRSFKV